MAEAENQTIESRKYLAEGLPRWKRILDLALILIASPFVLLLGSALAVVIWCGSRGPIFFRQRRVGYMGQEFLCYKFRTMHVGAETESHRGHTTHLIKSGTPMKKLDADDPRVIPLGSIIRATGLDELPQLINVLRGEMSLVGPRPCIPYEYEMYTTEQRRRFEGVPGLTGLWQVSGKNRTTFNRMIQLDIEYAETKNLWMDLRIIAMTIPALVVQCQDMSVEKSEEKVAAPSANSNAKARHSNQTSPAGMKPVESLQV